MKRPLLIIGLCLALLGLPLNAFAGQGVDLWVTQSDNPDPVGSGGLVTYTLVVGNEGPNPANNITVDLALSHGTFVSAGGHRWRCTLSTVTGSCSPTQNGGIPADKTAADLSVVVRAPDRDETSEFTHTAVVAAGAGYTEQAPLDNSWTETTEVQDATTGDVKNGITTCVHPGGTTAGDTTCATLQGDLGGEGTLIEKGDLEICTSVGCSGNSVDVIPPGGYDALTGHLKLTLEVDQSEFPDGIPNPIDGWVRKPSPVTGQVETVTIPSCATPTPGLPCQEGQQVQADGDLAVRFRLFSEDPIFELGDGLA